MLSAIIDFSLRNKFFILLATVGLTLAGIFALRNIPLDAIPDLSDTQVIIYTEWPGQAPQIVQDQVTYPITTKMLSVPRAKVVRGYSFYGFSFVYVIFEDGTDPYWARSRVLEYLSGLSGRLPQGVTPTPRPRRDRRGMGVHVFAQFAKSADLAELRSMQDWYLKYQLTSVEGVAEVASIGGFVKQYQVTVDPTKLRAYNLSIADVSMAIKKSNGEVGGRSIEMAEKEFILRVRGYIEATRRFEKGCSWRRRERRSDSAPGRCECAARPGHAPRHCGVEWRRRNGRRDRRHTLRRKCAGSNSARSSSGSTRR